MPLLKGLGIRGPSKSTVGSQVAEVPASFAKIHGARKIRILFFYPSTVGYSQEEESRQLEKLELPERSKRLYEIVG
jgi:hypothetical protein